MQVRACQLSASGPQLDRGTVTYAEWGAVAQRPAALSAHARKPEASANACLQHKVGEGEFVWVSASWEHEQGRWMVYGAYGVRARRTVKSCPWPH